MNAGFASRMVAHKEHEILKNPTYTVLIRVHLWHHGCVREGRGREGKGGSQYKLLKTSKSVSRQKSSFTSNVCLIIVLVTSIVVDKHES